MFLLKQAQTYFCAPFALLKQSEVCLRVLFVLLKQGQVCVCACFVLLKQNQARPNKHFALLKQDGDRTIPQPSIQKLGAHTMSNPDTATSTSPATSPPDAPPDLLADKAANEVAYETLKETLAATEPSPVLALNLKVASNRALHVYEEAREPDATEWLALVHEKIFDKNRIALLLTCAQAAAHIYAELSNAKSLKDNLHARLPAALVDLATEHRKKMLKVLDYILGDLPDVAQILTDIRSGSGYEDLSNDLYRLGQLYNQHHDTLDADRIRFNFADARTAYDLDAQISMALDQNRRERIAFWTQENARIITLLRSHYGEVAGTCRWLLRELDEDTLDERFPSLFSGRGGRPKKATETTAPAPNPLAEV